MTSSRNLVSTIGAQVSPKKVDGTTLGVWKGKLSLLACHTRCKCSTETTHNSVKVKLGINVMKGPRSSLCTQVPCLTVKNGIAAL